MERNVKLNEGKAIVTWNKEEKQSPLYTEEEVYRLVHNAMCEGTYYESEDFINSWEWFEKNKKK